MNYKIFKDGKHVNTILADESFVQSYCKKHGYTYEVEVPEPEPMPEPEPTEVEQLRADIDYIAIMTGVDLV